MTKAQIETFKAKLANVLAKEKAGNLTECEKDWSAAFFALVSLYICKQDKVTNLVNLAAEALENVPPDQKELQGAFCLGIKAAAEQFILSELVLDPPDFAESVISAAVEKVKGKTGPA
jgi:hypothetical protein